MIKKRIIFLVGPTGIGKSAAAISLAKKINAEIISCDSMQVYRKMDIITSKVSLAQRKNIKHHLLGIAGPGKEYNAAKYRKGALSICKKLFQKGKIPLFTGGTGLYYSVIIDGLFPKVSEDKLIRAKLNKELEFKGSRYLYRRLVKVDPQACDKIHFNDGRRIVRALEVYLKTGKPISVLQKSRVGLGEEYEIKIFGLNLNRQFLYERINQRVEKMFRIGLVKEVKRLLGFDKILRPFGPQDGLLGECRKKKLPRCQLSKTAACAIGIRELEGYFNGRWPLEEAKRLIQRNSRRYAKRQLTWFRKDKRVQWININNKETPARIALKLWKKLS